MSSLRHCLLPPYFRMSTMLRERLTICNFLSDRCSKRKRFSKQRRRRSSNRANLPWAQRETECVSFEKHINHDTSCKYRRDFVFEMHEAVQEAHQKFLSDLKLQKEKHSKEKEQMRGELLEMSHELEELKALNLKKERAMDDKEEQVRPTRFILSFTS